MAPSFLTFFDPSKIEWARAFPPRSVAHTLLETVCVTNFFPFRVAHTVLGTFKLLYRLTLFQPLYTCAYLQLLSSGGCTKTCSGGCQVGGFESKALPVKNYCYIRTDGSRTESHMEAAHCLKTPNTIWCFIFSTLVLKLCFEIKCDRRKWLRA